MIILIHKEDGPLVFQVNDNFCHNVKIWALLYRWIQAEPRIVIRIFDLSIK